jgi:hypothetical protein
MILEGPPLRSRILRRSLWGACAGAVAGLALVATSLLGGERVWAGMLLIGGVLSWPAGLWAFDASQSAIQAGVWGSRYLPLWAGPLFNGLVIGAIIGCADAITSRAPQRPPNSE